VIPKGHVRDVSPIYMQSAAFYARLGESFTLESIRDGTCYLLFTTDEVRRDAP